MQTFTQKFPHGSEVEGSESAASSITEAQPSTSNFEPRALLGQAEFQGEASKAMQQQNSLTL